MPDAQASLFAGPGSLRVPGERRAFWISLLDAPFVFALVGLSVANVSLSEFVLLVVGAMLLVSLGRGRLLGSSIRSDGRIGLPRCDDIRDAAGAIAAVASTCRPRSDFVGISGQTLGLMVIDLRVVTKRYVRPSPVQSARRYAAAFGSLRTAIAFVGFFVRVHPHDRLSRTRALLSRRTA